MLVADLASGARVGGKFSECELRGGDSESGRPIIAGDSALGDGVDSILIDAGAAIDLGLAAMVVIGGSDGPGSYMLPLDDVMAWAARIASV
jgi:ribosomal protein S6E (S10)